MTDTFGELRNDVAEIHESLADSGEIFDNDEKVLLKNFVDKFSTAVEEGDIDTVEQGQLLDKAFGNPETQVILSYPL